MRARATAEQARQPGLHEHDEDAVDRHEPAVGRLGDALLHHVEGQRGAVLPHHERGPHRERDEGEEDAVARDAPERRGLALAGGERGPRLGHPQQHDDAVDEQGRGVDREEREVAPAQRHACERGRDREAEVDDPVEVRVGAAAVLRRHDVGDHGRDRRPVHLGHPPHQEREGRDRRQLARQADAEQRDRAAERGQEDRGATAHAVGERAAGQARRHAARAVERHHDPGRRLAVAEPAREVDGQERHHEPARLVDERAEPQGPVEGRQAPVFAAQGVDQHGRDGTDHRGSPSGSATRAHCRTRAGTACALGPRLSRPLPGTCDARLPGVGGT